MKYRKLRIAWSVACGIACLLLVVLWVRSYWWQDIAFYRPAATTTAQFYFCEGAFYFSYFGESMQAPFVQLPLGWAFARIGAPASDVLGVPPLGALFKGFARPTPAIWQVPAWFPVLVSATLAAAPRLRWRFSLRTLLIAMTVAAIGLGWIVYALRK